MNFRPTTSIQTAAFAFVLMLLLFACKTTQPVVATPPAETTEEPQSDDIEIAENEEIDYDSLEDLAQTEPEIPNELPVYQASNRRVWDLIHTKLDISFDWAQQRANGSAQLILLPYAKPDSVLVLDAKNFDIKSIRILKSTENLKFEYPDSVKLVIQLGKKYTLKDTLKLQIEYTAKPAERKNISGSAAITSSQGLFFINHDNSNPNKPQQIWTQGETSYSSCWFPTIDSPNERCTQDISITVEDKFATLSNGILKTSKKNANGTRTDNWVMDQPHAPYLFMMAIGEFAVVKEKWKNIELGYYVEQKYKDHAKDIFAHTPEMLDFFSTKFGVVYPWQKYSQVVVRDYVSGAMENTTAVIFGDFVQRTKRQLIDNSNEKIVAHEMAHHWFGNYVTCESWSNLTLNEGFANYSEYLWLEHKHGLQEAEVHRQEEMQGYLQSTPAGATKHLIRFGYNNEEEMFDAHSYNKGGLVLHMLRKYLGDEVFFKSLTKYLKDNAYNAVEVHHLRLAFEAVSGEDLNWFFNQWYLDKGHPVLNVNYIYEEATKKLFLMVFQVQPAEDHVPVFEFPLEIDLLFANKSKERKTVRIHQRSQVIELDVESAPTDVVFNPEKTLLCVLEENYNSTAKGLELRYDHQTHYRTRLEAIAKSAALEDDKLYIDLCNKAVADSFWVMRAVGLSFLPEDNLSEDLIRKALQLADSDPHSVVRAQALEILAGVELSDAQQQSLLKILRKGEKETGVVIGAALSLLQLNNPELAATEIPKLEKDEDPSVITAISQYYAGTGDVTKLNYFVQNLHLVEGYEAITFMSNAYALASASENIPEQLRVGEIFYQKALNDLSAIQRYAVMQYFAGFIAEYTGVISEGKEPNMAENISALETFVGYFERIKQKETDPQLKSAYDYLR